MGLKKISINRIYYLSIICITAQKLTFFNKDSCWKCDQICRKLRVWSYSLKKSLMENFNFCAVLGHLHDFHIHMVRIKRCNVIYFQFKQICKKGK